MRTEPTSRYRSIAVFALATVATVVASASVALAKGYAEGFYAGRTAQGQAITFLVANGEVSALDSHIVDSCHPGTLDDLLYPNPARIDAAGDWSYRNTYLHKQPIVYHGQLAGDRASGTINDTLNNRKGRACHGRTTFHAARTNPVRIGPATVGNHGTDVELNVTMPPESDGNQLIPYTTTALLVYASNTGCPASYQSADALARSSDAAGYTGLISDAYVDTDYEVQPYELAYFGYQHGVFTFHVASNTVLPTGTGQSPFSTVCVMLYSGTPASLTPSLNTALATTQARLVPGEGIPDNQP